MRGLKLLCFAVSCNMLVGCVNADVPDRTILAFHSKTNCELIFKSDQTVIVENFCNSADKPILIKSPTHQLSLDWIDEETSRFVFQEGCASPGACFYEISINDSGVNGRFTYQVNLTEGEYSFDVDATGNVRVLSQSSRDLPS